MSEFTFKTLSKMKAEVSRRVDAGQVAIPSDEPWNRRVGFTVGSDDGGWDTLYVKVSNLTHDELIATGLVVASDPIVDEIFADALKDHYLTDLKDMIGELAEGEKAAREDYAKLPTEDQMDAWCVVVQAGIDAAGVNIRIGSRVPTRPFRRVCGTSDSRRHHADVTLCTDHAGMTLTVHDDRHNVMLFMERIAWADTDFTAERVAEVVKAAMTKYAQVPTCWCPRHRDKREEQPE